MGAVQTYDLQKPDSNFLNMLHRHACQRLAEFAKFALLIACTSISLSAYAALDTEIKFVEQDDKFYRFEILFSERVRYFSHRNLITNAELLSFRQIDEKSYAVELYLSSPDEEGVMLHLPRQQVYSIFGEWNINTLLYLPLASYAEAPREEEATGTTAIVANTELNSTQQPAAEVLTASNPVAAATDQVAEVALVSDADVADDADEAEAADPKVVSELGDNEVAPEVKQASTPAAGSVSAELYLLSAKNSRGKKVVQIKFSNPVQGIEKRHFYANTRVSAFYGEYDDYFLELQPFPEGEERTTRIALIADYYFNAELNRVIFVPIEVYAEFDANATNGSQAQVSYGTLSSNFVESIRKASAYIPPSGTAPVIMASAVGAETQQAQVSTISPIMSKSKLPGDVRDLSIKPPAEWQWGFLLNGGITSGGSNLVNSESGANVDIEIATVTDFPTAGIGLRWSTDQQFWQFQALLDYSSEKFATSDSESAFTRTDVHLQWIYPISAWTAMPFIRTLGISAGLTYSSPSIDHTGDIVTQTNYSRATDLGAALGYNYGLRWSSATGSSIIEFRTVDGLEYNAVFMKGDSVDLTAADSISGGYTGFFYSYVFQ